MSRTALAIRIVLFSTLSVLALNSDAANSTATQTPSAVDKSLRDIYRPYFKVGFAISDDMVGNPKDPRWDILRQHANVLTPENSFKWKWLHPQDRGFIEDLSKLRQLVENFDVLQSEAIKRGFDFELVGHPLFWIGQEPDHFPKDMVGDGKLLSAEALEAKMNAWASRLKSVVGDRLTYLDVLNEVFLNEVVAKKETTKDITALDVQAGMGKDPDVNGLSCESTYNRFLKDQDDKTWYSARRRVNSQHFFESLKADFPYKAFRIARNHFPDIPLIYNDYSVYNKGKRCAIIRMVKDIERRDSAQRKPGEQAIGPIVVGVQAHWRSSPKHDEAPGKPSIEQIHDMLADFEKAGIKVHITEFDVDPLPREVNGRQCTEIPRSDTEFKQCDPLKPKNGDNGKQYLMAQAVYYREVMKLFVSHAGNIDRLSFWSISDHKNWLNQEPVKDRYNSPALFDRGGSPKLF